MDKIPKWLVVDMTGASYSRELDAHTFDGFAQCIFCFGSPNSEEHVILGGLSGRDSKGSRQQVVIRNGSCSACNNRLNQEFENELMQTVFLGVRVWLDLPRKQRGAKTGKKELS